MSFSVIIPSRNIDNLRHCVQAVASHEQDPRIVVIDDSDLGDERIYDLCARDGIARVKGIKPFVFARAINQGIGHLLDVSGFLLLNDDALLKSPRGFSVLEESSYLHPEYGVIGAVTNVTGSPEQMPQKVGLREVNVIAYVCVYIPRSTIVKVGMLDERFCKDYGCEDADHIRAIRHAGMKIGVHDGCFVDHASLRSTYRGDPHASRSFVQNQQLLDEKWRGIA